MHPNSRQSLFPSAADLTAWLLNLATRLVAHSLNLPAPLVHTTGVFVFAQVQAAETRIGRTLCPVRLWRRVRASIEGFNRSGHR